MIHLPKAQEVLDAEGGYLTGVDASEWDGYFARTFSQLTWWASAAQQYNQSETSKPKPSAFTRSPSQRNAP